jgi:methionyl-tRNA formyltransferase
VALRIVFCGTPAFAVPSLERLLKEPDFEVIGVVTQPDRPSGRGQQLHGSAVKRAAVAAELPIYQPEKIKSDEAYEYFGRLAPDAVVIIAYGQIISQRLIAIPRLGWINLHASLLPKYRGAAPINWAIINGEKITGLTTMRINTGLDTGPTLLKYETGIAADETALELTAQLAQAGAPLIVETLRKLAAGEISATPQDDSQATLAPILKKEDGRIDWWLSAFKIYNRMRGMQPWPGAFTTFRGKNCQIWGKPLRPVSAGGQPGIILPTKEDGMLVICGANTVLRVEHLQLEGRKRVTDAEFMSGARIVPGERFGD